VRTLALPLIVLFVLSCSGYRERRVVTAKAFATTLYPGWTVLGVVASDACQEPARYVSITVQDPKTGTIHRIVLKCFVEGDDPC
jgi:hypothetical protein